MATLHLRGHAGHALRAAISIAAALSVLGFTSLVWLHGSSAPIVANSHVAAAASYPGASEAVLSPATSRPSGVPSLESVFPGSAFGAVETIA